MFRPILLALLLYGSLLPVSAQSGEEKWARLLEGLERKAAALAELRKTDSLHCKFTVGTQADWDAGSPVMEHSEWSDPMVFYSIDLASATAKAMGNQGADQVTVLFAESGITFVERTAKGSFNVTTVFATYRKGTRDFVAVHSRHLLMVDYPFPSQFHGTCRIAEEKGN